VHLVHVKNETQIGCAVTIAVPLASWQLQRLEAIESGSVSGTVWLSVEPWTSRLLPA